MAGKELREKLLHGETVYGTIIQHLINPGIVDVIPDGVLDFVVLTSEHSALDLAEFLPLRYALATKGIASLVRIHGRDEADVSKVCDVFDGVVIPYAEDYQQIRRLAAAAVYRPLKGKVLERVLTEGIWPSEKTKQHIEAKNADKVFIPMIESVPAVDDLERICGIPGVHAVFVGPGDLTANMGIPGEYDHPDLVATMQKIIDTANAHHVAAGSWFGKEYQAKRTIQQGARLVVYSNDGLLLGNAIQDAFGKLT